MARAKRGTHRVTCQFSWKDDDVWTVFGTKTQAQKALRKAFHNDALYDMLKHGKTEQLCDEGYFQAKIEYYVDEKESTDGQDPGVSRDSQGREA